jgi:nucleoside-diphosphate-sugar epimerase
MRLAVTGAAGFLGGALVARWRAAGRDVVPIVRTVDARSPPGSLALEGLLDSPEPLRGIDVLVHAAAIRHRHGVDAKAYRATNVQLLERLVRALAGRVRRLVHVSSVGVYGFPSDLPIRETHPFAPRTLYSATKVEAEKLVRRLGAEHGVEIVVVRPTIVYGPGDTNGMLDKLARMIRAGTYRVVGSGENVLHHTYVDDVADGIERAAAVPAAAGDHFILAGPETITLRALSELTARTLGTKLPRVHIPLAFARSTEASRLLPQARSPPSTTRSSTS